MPASLFSRFPASIRTSIGAPIRPLLAGLLLLAVGATPAAAARPNILVLWHDGISPTAISAYGHGVVGEQTPAIDRLAADGTAFTDAYGEVTAAAAQAAFLTGRFAVRTGLAGAAAGAITATATGTATKDAAAEASTATGRSDAVPGPAEPTLAQLLRALGYATGRFGLDRIGVGLTDLGFDNFYGAVLPAGSATDTISATDPARATAAGEAPVLHLQRQPDGHLQRDPVGRLDAWRRARLDAETAARALTFIEQQQATGRPWFVWWSAVGAQTAATTVSTAETLTETRTSLALHDAQVGQFLSRLDELGITGETLVLYVGATGVAPPASLPSAPGMLGPLGPPETPRTVGDELAYRVPWLVRWPAQVPAGVWRNDPIHLLDALPTLLAAAGAPDLPALLAAGIALQPVGTPYQADLDGVNQLPLLRGEAARGARQALLYWSADGLPIALRVDDWKLVFAVPVAVPGATLAAPWAQPLAALRAPLLINLRQAAAGLPAAAQAPAASRADEWVTAYAGLLAVARVHLEALAASLQRFAPQSAEAQAGIAWMLTRLPPAQ